MHVKVKKLQIENIKHHRISLLLGRRGSGKSVLLRDMLANMHDRFDFALAMCPTLESSELLKEHMPSCCVFDRYVQSKVDALVKLASETTASGHTRSFLLILDDVMYDKAICRTQSFRYLFYNGRHAKITCILLLQYLVDMPPDMFCAVAASNAQLPPARDAPGSPSCVLGGARLRDGVRRRAARGEWIARERERCGKPVAPRTSFFKYATAQKWKERPRIAEDNSPFVPISIKQLLGFR